MIEMTRTMANDAAMDAANRNMRKNGREQWSEEDYNIAHKEFERLWPWDKIFHNAKRG